MEKSEITISNNQSYKAHDIPLTIGEQIKMLNEKGLIKKQGEQNGSKTKSQ